MTGGRLTDVADAVLIDPTIVRRIVVVSSMGTVTATGGAMSNPNGEMDPWADAIVTASLPFVQVSAYYDQLTDVPASSVPQLPANPFGAWIAAKQPNIWSLQQSADQVGIIAVGVPEFAVTVERVAAGFDGRAGCHRGARSGHQHERAGLARDAEQGGGGDGAVLAHPHRPRDLQPLKFLQNRPGLGAVARHGSICIVPARRFFGFRAAGRVLQLGLWRRG